MTGNLGDGTEVGVGYEGGPDVALNKVLGARGEEGV